MLTYYAKLTTRDRIKWNTYLANFFLFQLQCCGTTGPDFYEELPITCCSEEIINTQHECLLEYAFSIGCVDLLRNSIDNIGNTMKKVLIWAIVIEVRL